MQRHLSTYDIALRADQLLRTCARDHVLVSRRLGQGLAHMAQASHFASLGYSCMENYATQRLGISGRSAQELAWLERGVAKYPAIDKAYDRGDLTFSHVRRLLQAAIPLEDERAWAERAASMSIAQLEEALEEWRAGGAPPLQAQDEPGDYPLHEPEEDEPQTHSIKCHVRPSVYLKFELALEVARRMHGADLPLGALLECMMAEYLNGSGGQILAGLAVGEEDEQAQDIPGAVLPWRRPRVDVGRIRRDLDVSLAELTEHWRHLNWEVPPLPAHPSHDATADAAEMDCHLHAISRFANARECELMKLLAMVADDHLYDWLEFSNLRHYAAERLGFSARTASTLVSLQRRIRRLPLVLQAFRDGRINRTQADLVSQVATAHTQQVWLDHARATTVKCLRQDVKQASRLRDLDAAAYMEEGILPGDVDRGQACAPVNSHVQVCAPTLEDEDEAPSIAAAEVGSRSVRERLHMFREGRLDDVENSDVLTVRFQLPHSLLGMWRDVYRACEAVLGNMVTVGDCLEVCADAFLTTWAPEALRSMREHRVLERDGWICANPTCTRRAQLHDHHVRFRSAGGSNALDNRLTLCRYCHLRLVHENRIRVQGTAPGDLTWELGSPAHLLIIGRRIVGGSACQPYVQAEVYAS